METDPNKFRVMGDHPQSARPDRVFRKSQWDQANAYAKKLFDLGFEDVRIEDLDGEVLPCFTDHWSFSAEEYETAIQQMEQAFAKNKSRRWVLKCLRDRLKNNRIA